jgi:glycosyltransferase involved in cell wall biosynthesis
LKAHIIKDNSKQNTPANKTIKLTGKGPYHGHPIRLTIGLIVKNEEKTLDRCLSSLQPLMQAVESELIITDTGSTDRTVEIAKKYTDHIIHFQWCNDFAAARNTGLKEARGEWFMFIDGDEWFEDTSELIEFFTSGECDKYGSAAYIQRNYFDFTGKVYRDFHALRVHRVYPGIRFQGIIHEAVPTLKPIKILKDYVHHYGYAFHTPQQRKEKSNRNLTLLQQIIAKDPDNHRAYYQIAETYFATNEAEKAEKYCLKGLEAEKRNPDRVARIVFDTSFGTS